MATTRAGIASSRKGGAPKETPLSLEAVEDTRSGWESSSTLSMDYTKRHWGGRERDMTARLPVAGSWVITIGRGGLSLFCSASRACSSSPSSHHSVSLPPAVDADDRKEAVKTASEGQESMHEAYSSPRKGA
ncbi:hypothetical protein MUK42_17716 [Musa troglodytarum]|uniref:Uncharacterized protein n=1 Tax=Musa troglodytarum TaxID=320322 RepID=A0A9E7KJI4_9LILI|nr:hypothetical protein MUK42_17716 [Musa troglodytarum]